MGELFFSTVVLGLFGFLFYGTTQINVVRSVDPVGPVLFPQLVVALAAVLCSSVIADNIKSGEFKKAAHRVNPNILLFAAVLAAVACFVEFLGFFVSCALLFAAVGWILGNRKALQNLLISLVSSAAMILLFGRILSVPLPRGEGLFEIFSHWLY